MRYWKQVQYWLYRSFWFLFSRRTYTGARIAHGLKRHPDKTSRTTHRSAAAEALGADPYAFYKGVSQRLWSAEDVSAQERKTWKNHTATQVVQPLRFEAPPDLKAIQNMLTRAKKTGDRVKAVGSGHSFSDVAVTTDILVETHQLNRELPLEAVRSNIDRSTLLNIESGITIHDLNILLDSKDLALVNMGGYDAQTAIGAISTGTHGSGITLGPIGESVVSIDLVSENGIVYRIEPTDGITDPVEFAKRFPDRILKQDDKWFYSSVISMGTMGIVYSLVYRAMKKYWLAETRTLKKWSDIKRSLESAEPPYRKHRHYEVLVNPYIIDGDHWCIETVRDIVPKPDVPDIFRPHRNMFADLLGRIPGFSDVLLFLFNTFPELSPDMIQQAMKVLEDKGYVDLSYKVFNLGSANFVNAFSAEIGFPVEDNMYIEAVEEIIRLAAHAQAEGDVYQTSPFSLRFTAASKHYLAMMHGRETCMIEMPIVAGTFGGMEVLRRYEAASYKHSGRPHWGQIQYVTGNDGFIKKLYPEFETWLSVYHELVQTNMFANTFTDRCGITKPRR